MGRSVNARSTDARRQAKNTATIVVDTDEARAMPATPSQAPNTTSRITLVVTLVIPPARSTTLVRRALWAPASTGESSTPR